MSAAPDNSVAAVRAQVLPAVQPYLEPGEQVQVVVPAETGLPPALAVALDFGGDVATGTSNPIAGLTGGVAAFVGRRRVKEYVLVATDRAFIVLRGDRREVTKLTFHVRCRRDVRLQASWRHTTPGLDQPYVVSPTWEDHVRSANEALDALQTGRPWTLGADADRSPVADVSYPARRARRKLAKQRRAQD